MSSFNVTFEENSGSMFSKILANVITEYFREHPSDRISAEELASAVNGYLSEHPIEGMTAEDVNGLISAYMSEHPVSGGVDTEEVNTIISEYLTNHPVSGVKGDKGDKGDTGAKGDKGDKGDTGEQGRTGANGASAYGVAVANGYEGTEEEWLLSLKGDKGDSVTDEEITQLIGEYITEHPIEGVSEEQIAQSVNQYLKENPIEEISNPLYDNSGFSKSSIVLMGEMLKGINIGNQFESYNNNIVDDSTAKDKVLFYETLWGNPKVSEKYIEYLASVGFDAVRLPISWGNHIDSKDNLISVAWLERIKKVVELIISNGMYCIINVHHDGSHKWKKLVFDNAHKTQSMAYFANLWYQIGDYFKDYGYKLLFEPYNEVTDNDGSMSATTARETIAAEFAQAFINIIRSQGGNNDKRFLVIPNYSGVSFMSNTTFNTLTDSASDKLLLTTHIYPSENSAQSAISGAKTKVNQLGIGVTIDEIGVMPSDKYDLAFMQSLRSYADSNGISTFWWDNGLREYNLIDRFYCKPSNAALAEYVGEEIAQDIYTEPFENVYMPYRAKFYTESPKSFNKRKYLVVCSQKPITTITAVDNWQGYYAISGNEGGLYSIFVSDDDISYKLLETQLCNNSSKQIIGTKHILYGTTSDSYYVSGNYTIENAPTQNFHCTGITADDTLTVNGTGAIAYTIEPSNCTDAVSFASADSSIARVDNSGNVTAVASGTTTITITCGEQTKTITVTAIKDENAETTVVLPSDYETTAIFNSVPFKQKFPYYMVFHDLTNNLYRAIYSVTKVTTIAYNSYQQAIGMMWSGNNDFYQKRSDTGIFEDIGTVSATQKLNGTGYYNKHTTLTTLTDPSEIEVVAANYDIEGWYTVPTEET